MIRWALFAFLLLVQGTVADARWREASTHHFLIYSEGDEAELRQAAEEIERYDSALRNVTGVGDPDRGPSVRVTIFFVRDVHVLRGLFGGRDSGIWAFYLPHTRGTIVAPRRGPRPIHASNSIQGRLPDEIQESFTARGVMLHEYTHHFMFNNFNFGAPLWLSEGYPEFLSTAQFGEDGSITIGTPPWYRNFEIAQAGDIDARQILLRPAQNYRVAGIYGIGWLMSHYLTFDPARYPQLRAYMQALSNGREPQEAASAFGDLDQLTSDLRRYRRAREFPVSRIAPERISIGRIAIRELSEAENAIMDVRIRSKVGVNRRTAPSVARDARRAAAAYPNDPFVQVSLAEAELDARNYAEAEAAADRALAADPNNVDAHLYKARAIWGRAEALQDRNPQTWREVRTILAAANRLDPDNPEPLKLFYQTYEPSGEAPTENAVNGLMAAHEGAPQDSELRLLATRERLLRNELDRARLLFAPIVNGAHGRENREKVAQVMELIHAGDARGALTRLDELRAEAKREAEGD
ncbi:MAG TPA: hypothetical protein VGX37_06955 [Allosphingosinicella sp.]|nr:hypothetical protein [Allosphingosinicella sp.]